MQAKHFKNPFFLCFIMYRKKILLALTCNDAKARFHGFQVHCYKKLRDKKLNLGINHVFLTLSHWSQNLFLNLRKDFNCEIMKYEFVRSWLNFDFISHRMQIRADFAYKRLQTLYWIYVNLHFGRFPRYKSFSYFFYSHS